MVMKYTTFCIFLGRMVALQMFNQDASDHLL